MPLSLPSFPVGGFQVVVEPTKQNLVWGKFQEFIQSFAILEQAVKFRMELDINLAEQTAFDDLPNQTKNQMLSSFDDILRTNVDNRASNSLGRVDDNVVVFNHLEVVYLFGGVQDTLINSIRDGIVDKLTKDETIYGKKS